MDHYNLGRVILAVAPSGEAFLARYGRLCGRPAYPGQPGQLYMGWTEYQSISPAMAVRWMRRPEFARIVRSNAAWGAWETAVNVYGIGHDASAVFAACS